MISIRTIKYEYKVISSYYDNYVKQHRYDTIKGVVMRLPTSSMSQETILINQLHQLLLLCDSSGIGDITLLIKHYQYTMQCDIRSDLQLQIVDIANQYSRTPLNTIVTFLDMAKEGSVQESFFCFLLATLFANHYYGEYIVIPVYLADELNQIHDNDIRLAFFDGHIRRIKKNYTTDMLPAVTSAYASDHNHFIANDIEAIYLFGSIAKGEDTEYSDIDLVLKISSKNEDDIKNAVDVVRAYNKRTFGKRSDIHLYDDFIIDHSDYSLIKLV